MAEPTSATSAVAPPLPDPELLARAESFTREPFVLPGEDPETALAPGTPRRRALDAALAEIAEGRDVPSTAWRREFSLMLGLERLLSQDEPRLADGTLLNPHQVDALSGTLTALLAEGSRPANGNGAAHAPAAANGAAPAPPVLGGDDEETVGDDEEIVGDDEEPVDYDAEAEAAEAVEEAVEDPNAHKRFWFEHATGAGKTVAAMGFVEASRTGGVLILTHRRNLVDQFNDELRQRGYSHRVTPPLMKGQDRANGPVTVETYQWFVRHAGNISSSYTVVICDEAHTALGEKTAAAIREWTGPIFIGMTATGALIARHVTDLFPTQTSRFDLAQAARRGVIAPLRCVRIPPGPGVRTIAKVPLRRGEVDTEFDQEMLAELLDQLPFNLAAANLYKTRFDKLPGVVYAAGVRHAYNLAEAFRQEGIKAQAVSGETPKRELAEILARYERGEIDVLINAQLLAEGWNSPRATVCFHLAPTASKRIYQQRVGRVTRRHPGKEAGIVVDFVHPATKHDDPVVTLHSLLDRDVYRGGAIVVGPVRRGRGRRIRVERRVLPVTADENRRIEVFERELWRIAVEHLDWGEQIQWAALAGARVVPSGWRRARAMLHFDKTGELKRTFLLTAVQRNKNPQLRLRALQEIAAARDPEAFDVALDEVGGWPRDEKREACKTMLQALAEKRIGRRDQADAWIWRIAGYTAELHEEYAVQRWPETKRLLGLLANSASGGHARNARRLVHAARKQDRRLAAALLAAAIRYTHTPEAEEILRGARSRMARKPASLSRDLLRNFPKGRRGRGRRRRKKGVEEGAVEAVQAAAAETLVASGVDGAADAPQGAGDAEPVVAADDAAGGPQAVADGAGGEEQGVLEMVEGEPRDERGEEESEAFERQADVGAEEAREMDEAVGAPDHAAPSADGAAAEEAPAPKRRGTTRRRKKADTEAEPASVDAASEATDADAAPAQDALPIEEAPKPKRTTRRRQKVETEASDVDAMAAATAEAAAEEESAKPKRTTTRRGKKAESESVEAETATPDATGEAASAAAAADASGDEDAPKPKRTTTRRRKKTEADASDAAAENAEATATASAEALAEEAPKARRTTTRRRKQADADAPDAAAAENAEATAVATTELLADEAPRPKRTTTRRRTKAAEAETPAAEADAEADEPTPKRRTTRTRKTKAEAEAVPAEADAAAPAEGPKKRATTRRRKTADEEEAAAAEVEAAESAEDEPKPKRRTTRTRKTAETETPVAETDAAGAEAGDESKPKRRTTRTRKTTEAAAAAEALAEEAPKKRTTTRRRKKADADAEAPAAAELEAADAPKPKRTTTRRRKTADAA